MSGDNKNVLGALAEYAMSEDDDEPEDMHKLSGNISGSDDEGSTHSQVPSRTYSPVLKDDEPPKKRKTPVSSLGLVSYGGHDDEESDRDVSKSDSENDDVRSASSADGSQTNENKGVVDYEKTFTTEDQSQVNGSSTEEEFTDVQIPPSPPGSPPKSLIENIVKLCKRGQGSLDAIQNRKDFRNPSIYEKLLSHVGVNEKGTNYPPELYDPSIWDKSSYYDELAKLQNIEMEKRKAEKKVKVDFIVGTKTLTTTTADSGDASANKKSKWDNASRQTSQAQTGSSAPPVGSLIKKK